MAQPIYSTSVNIDQFKGFNQTGDGYNQSMRYAREMENVNVTGGSFQPMRAGIRMEQGLPGPIGTLAYVYRRYGPRAGTYLLAAICAGKLYTKELDADDEWVERFDGLTEDDCDWTTYETNQRPNYSRALIYHAGDKVMYKKPTEERTVTEFDGITVYRCKSRYSHVATLPGVTGPFDSSKWYVYSQVKTNDGTNSYFDPIPFFSEDENYTYTAMVAVPYSNDETQYSLYSVDRNGVTAGHEFNPAEWTLKARVSPYSESRSYYKDDLVWFEHSSTYTETVEYEPEIYICTADIETPEEWNPAHWELAEETDEPTDVLLFTNAKDGMYCLYGDTMEVRPVPVTPDPENNPGENIKFGVIARYNERIWGCGIEGDPDKLMYSAPYNAFDWAPNFDIPEDGAGDILQPTWDGDSFQSLRQYGSVLLALKKNSVWRIYGTDPSTFTMQMQYGSGTIEENSLAIYGDSALMLGENGMMRYNGEAATPFGQEATRLLFHDRVNHDMIHKACAAMRRTTYCLALPIDESERCNAILEYNLEENTLALRTGISVDSFLNIGDRLFFTSSTTPGYVFEMRDDVGETLPCKWVSGYQDLGLKGSIKSAFQVYVMVESEAPVELRLGIRTEKKLKQKVIYTKPGKMLRKRLNMQGREFRLEIESFSAVPFTIAGGIKIDLELDPD